MIFSSIRFSTFISKEASAEITVDLIFYDSQAESNNIARKAKKNGLAHLLS